MIAVIDYKAGNLASVVKALRFVGSEALCVTQDPEVIRRAAKLVLPGVGHFRATRLLETLQITEAVRESLERGTYFLGICVGMQWLFEGSTEAEETRGLGRFNGRCERFPATYQGVELKSPHVGWNSLEEICEDSRLLRGLSPGVYVYYTHSWRAPVIKETSSVTNYGGEFSGVVEDANVMGVQFHPEKSGSAGLQVLRNFLEL